MGGGHGAVFSVSRQKQIVLPMLTKFDTFQSGARVKAPIRMFPRVGQSVPAKEPPDDGTERPIT